MMRNGRSAMMHSKSFGEGSDGKPDQIRNEGTGGYSFLPMRSTEMVLAFWGVSGQIYKSIHHSPYL
jgi:hypothetical protein